MTSTQTADILFNEMTGQGGDLGIITLNRPQALNALSYEMIDKMQTHLQKWAIASHIKAVVIRAAEGRAFCAGGDLRLMYQRHQAHDPNVIQYFQQEYRLNHTIYHYPKPYIALLDGITFGGGVGISVHGSHRIATDRLVFAMPETGIGFFPDVGGTYFLPRLSNHVGFYLGLAGARMTADDCMALGITQHKVSHEALADIIHALAGKNFNNDATSSVTNVIKPFQVKPNESSVLQEEKSIQAYFSLSSIEDIINALQGSTTKVAKEAMNLLMNKSPTSLKVTLRALQLGATFNFDLCMQQEYRLVTRFLAGHDFLEGIRAVIIDKDQKPQWSPSTLEEVNFNEVEKYFLPLQRELF